MSRTPMPKPAKDDDDSWGKLASDLLGIEFGGEDDFDFPEPEVAISSEPVAAEIPCPEPIPTAEIADANAETVASPSLEESSERIRSDDEFWKVLEEWDWDESGTRPRSGQAKRRAATESEEQATPVARQADDSGDDRTTRGPRGRRSSRSRSGRDEGRGREDVVAADRQVARERPADFEEVTSRDEISSRPAPRAETSSRRDDTERFAEKPTERSADRTSDRPRGRGRSRDDIAAPREVAESGSRDFSSRDIGAKDAGLRENNTREDRKPSRSAEVRAERAPRGERPPREERTSREERPARPTAKPSAPQRMARSAGDEFGDGLESSGGIDDPWEDLEELKVAKPAVARLSDFDDDFEDDVPAATREDGEQQDSGEDDDEERPRRRRRRRRRTRRSETAESSTSERTADLESPEAVADDDEEDYVEPRAVAADEPAEEADEDGEPRRRRRRRRRRPEESESREAPVRSAAPAERESRPVRSRPVEDDVEDDFDEPAPRPVARYTYDDIPTWEEAIAYMLPSRTGGDQRGSAEHRGPGGSRGGDRRPPRQGNGRRSDW